MIAALTKSHEEQSQRQTAHLNAVLEQKLQDEQVNKIKLRVYMYGEEYI